MESGKVGIRQVSSHSTTSVISPLITFVNRCIVFHTLEYRSVVLSVLIVALVEYFQIAIFWDMFECDTTGVQLR